MDESESITKGKAITESADSKLELIYRQALLVSFGLSAVVALPILFRNLFLGLRKISHLSFSSLPLRERTGYFGGSLADVLFYVFLLFLFNTLLLLGITSLSVWRKVRQEKKTKTTDPKLLLTIKQYRGMLVGAAITFLVAVFIGNPDGVIFSVLFVPIAILIIFFVRLAVVNLLPWFDIVSVFVDTSRGSNLFEDLPFLLFPVVLIIFARIIQRGFVRVTTNRHHLTELEIKKQIRQGVGRAVLLVVIYIIFSICLFYLSGSHGFSI